jgi:uncharacterized iron-regulated protein
MFENENSLSVLAHAIRNEGLSNEARVEAKKRYDYVKTHRENNKNRIKSSSDYLRILSKSDYRPSMIEFYTKEYMKVLEANPQQ